MPFLSEKEVKERLESPDNLINRLEIIEKKSGREGVPNLPDPIHRVITALALSDDSDEQQKDIARTFGVSASAVSELVRENPRQDISAVRARVQDRNQVKREQAEDKAVDTLLQALDIIPAALEGDSKRAKRISSVAKDLAEISESISGRDREKKEEKDLQVHLHIYRPHQKQVEDYEIIDV